MTIYKVNQLFSLYFTKVNETRHHRHSGPANGEDVVHLPYCVHTLNTKTIHSNLNNLNTFTKEIGSSNVKLILLSNLNSFTREISSSNVKLILVNNLNTFTKEISSSNVKLILLNNLNSFTREISSSNVKLILLNNLNTFHQRNRFI